MSSELRWILLTLGIAFIVGLALWERRRPRQASASSASERPAPRDLRGEGAPRAPREPGLALPEMRARDPLSAQQLPVVELAGDADAPGAEAAAETYGHAAAERPQGDLTDEVAALRAEVADAADSRHEPPATPPRERSAEAAFSYVPKAEPAPQAPARATVMEAKPGREALPELPAAAPPVVEWPADDKRRIVALRLVAPQPQRFAGRSLRQALAAEGFVLGRFAIFHKPDEERRAVLSAANLNRPGTFDPETMDSQHYGGLSLFAVLPGPKPPPQAFDELVFTARSLNERLHGVLQDEQGGPLTPSRIASLRERLAGAAL